MKPLSLGQDWSWDEYHGSFISHLVFFAFRDFITLVFFADRSDRASCYVAAGRLCILCSRLMRRRKEGPSWVWDGRRQGL